MTAFDALPDVLTPPEVAKVLRVGRNQAYELIRQGLLPSFRIGCRIRVAKRALLDFVYRQGEKPP
jgi:excisionase family DNA binding protein